VRPKGLVSFFRRPSTALLSLFFFLAVPCSAQRNPVKLDVNPVASRVAPGAKAGIRITLLDSDNRPINAPKDLAIQIQARLSPADPPQELMDVTMKAGQTSQTFTVPLRPELRGFVYLWARHEELLAGGAFLRVADSVPHTHAPKRPRPPEKAEPKGTLTPRGGDPPEPAPKPEARRLPSLILRFSPQRLFLADGKDAVTIHAFLLREDAGSSEDFRVRLFQGSGILAPNPMVIHKGEDVAKATLKSNEQGTVIVEYLDSVPTARLEGDRKLEIKFGPPITRLELSPNPQDITLLDRSDLFVHLVDDKGKPVRTAEERLISVAISRGRGEISPKEFTILPGQSGGRATFEPVWWGDFQITASTPNLFSITAPLNVRLPLAMMGFSALGGLLGGLLVILTRRRTRWWRLVVGLIAGFLFYWIGLLGLIHVLPRGLVLNPLTAFTFSVFGGWFGIEALTHILKRVGFVGAPSFPGIGFTRKISAFKRRRHTGHHVFVCYARDDEDFVLDLAAKLKERGISIWVDQADIPPGANWDKAIDKALHECASFLIVLSPAAIQSSEATGELRTALDERKPIVPVLLEKCPIPRQLKNIQYVDFTSGDPEDEEALNRVTAVLSSHGA
jgi:TIR domain